MPRIFYFILSFLIFNNHKDSVLGDYEELYNYKKEKEGALKAIGWLLLQILLLIPDYFRNSLSWGTYMFGNYFKIGLRTIFNDKLHSLINILGLSVGISISIILLIFLHLEMSYDSIHEDADNIYRVYTVSESSGKGTKTVALTMGQFTEGLNSITGIEGSVKLFNLGNSKYKVGDETKSGIKTFTASSGFFDVFSFKILSGDKNEILSEPNTAVITKETAFKLFGKYDAVGEVFTSSNRDYKVQAVIENIPETSHFRFDMLLSHKSIPGLDTMTSNEFYTYFKIADNKNEEHILQLAYNKCYEYLKPRSKKGYVGFPGFQKLKDVHLYSSDFGYKIGEHGNIKLIYILAILATSILIIAALNFVNLLTARSQNRFKEIAVRRVIGADKSSVLIQYISESLVVSIFATMLAGVLIYFSLGEAKVLLGSDLSEYYNYFFPIMAGVMGLSFVIGVVSSIYPSLVVSGFAPAKILRNKNSSTSNRKLISSTVLIQFSIVVIMIVSVMVIYDQVNFLKEKDLGFEKNQVLFFDLENSKNYETIKNEISQIAGVNSVTGSQSVPGKIRSGQLGKILGLGIQNEIGIKENRVQNDFVKTYGLKIIAGRDFDYSSKAERNNLILNETAIKTFGLTPEEAIGKQFDYLDYPMEIIGIVADYNFASLHSSIEPLILSRYSPRVFLMSANVDTENISTIISAIKNKVKEVEPESIFNYKFLDESFAEMYNKEENQYAIIFFASVIAIIISIMGLFALTSFSVTKRTKEIGLRKVMGASTAKIIFLLLQDFSKYIIISMLIAWPVAYYLLDNWLKNFAFKIELSVGYFATSAMITIAVAFMTVIYLTAKAALQNPVDSIKCE